MAELLAKGQEPNHWWRKTLPDAQVSLGRDARQSEWAVQWDSQISRQHACLNFKDGLLRVLANPGARNPIYFQGVAAPEFSISTGQFFVIGNTTFTLEDEPPTAPTDAATISEMTCSPDELRQVRYTDADERIDVLAELPDLIRFSDSDEELHRRVVLALLRGVKRADFAAIVRTGVEEEASTAAVKAECWDHRSGAQTSPRISRRLVDAAVRRRRQSVMHLSSPATAEEFTALPDHDWAICAPLSDEPEPGWALYAAGREPAGTANSLDAHQLNQRKGDIKFIELVAAIFGSLRQIRGLENLNQVLGRFLPAPVTTRLRGLTARETDEALKPCQTDITVLFCDLRGSCRVAEQNRDDLGLAWERIREALEIITTSISEQDGLIGDFQGDAAMGFWGWPFDGDDAVSKACHAALSIRRDFLRASARPGGPLAGFACGIGIASGSGIAGRLGTLDQFKVGVFGPVVNLAARLETMSKSFGVPILIDQTTADQLRQSGNLHAWARCRRLAQVRPVGMDQAVLINELLPPITAPPPNLGDQSLRDYAAGLDHFATGRWTEAQSLLERLRHDGAAKFLRNFMERHQNIAPPNWDGVIQLTSK